MKRRIIRLAGAISVAGASVVTGLVGAAPAHADTNLIGWTAVADANVVDLVIDNAAGLAGSHPVSEIDIPEDTADFETGPLGFGLASLVWPGSVLGNAGSLAGEAGLPSQLAPIGDKLNDPVRAQSFYPAGPQDATFPSGSSSSGAMEMVSHADANQSWAKAGVADVTVPGLFDLRAVQGSSTASAADVAKSTATGSFNSLSLLGGLITIGATDSTATAQSDGNEPDGTSTSHIGAVTVAGQQVSIGTDGIIVGPASTSSSGLLSALPTNLVSQVVSAINLKITPLPQTETNQAPAEQITSAGLQISFSLPSNLNLSLNCPQLPGQLAQLGILCTLPGLLQGLTVDMTVGRVTAEAIAAPPFAIAVDQGGLGLLPGIGVTAADTGTTSPLDLGLPGAGPTASPAASGPVPAQGLRHSAPVSLSSPIGVGLLIGLLAAAVAVGLGLRRLTGLLGAPAADHCPLEEAP